MRRTRLSPWEERWEESEGGEQARNRRGPHVEYRPKGK